MEKQTRDCAGFLEKSKKLENEAVWRGSANAPRMVYGGSRLLDTKMPGSLSDYLRAIAEEEETEESTAEQIAKGRLARERLQDELASLIENNHGSKAPQGYSNRPKTLEVIGFMERAGFKDKESVKRKFSDLLVQARQCVQLQGISDLDRVWMAIKQGSVR